MNLKSNYSLKYNFLNIGFVRMFLKYMKYPEDYEEYLTVGLIALFKEAKDYEIKNQQSQ
jgi:hypothetical protein